MVDPGALRTKKEMWTAQILAERQRARRAHQQQQPPPPPTPEASHHTGIALALPVSPVSSTGGQLPLRRDQIARLNRWLSAKAANEGAASFDAIPEEATAGQLAVHPGITMPLLQAVGASLAQLLGSGIGIATLKEFGLDAVYLAAHPHAALQLSNSFGRAVVVQTMLSSSADAVVLAGSMTATNLGITTRQLLQTAARGNRVGNVRIEATTILDQERVRHACLLGDQLRATGQPAALRAEQAMLQGCAVRDLASVGLDAQLLTTRYKLSLDELGRCLGARALSEMRAIGVVIV